jgi:hypothetical protein
MARSPYHEDTMPSKLPKLNVRLEPRILDLIARLCEETGLSQAAVVAQGVRLFARREGVRANQGSEKIPKNPRNRA